MTLEMVLSEYNEDLIFLFDLRPHRVYKTPVGKAIILSVE